MLNLKIKNITGSFVRADYHFELWVNDKKIAEGETMDFQRGLGYAALLWRIAKVLAEQGNPGPEDTPEDA